MNGPQILEPRPAPQGHRSPTLRSKLRVPSAPVELVRRQRLLDLLDDILDRPLTVVGSPAGSGKTTLLAQWISTAPIPSSWLSLDDDDADAGQFLHDFIAAIDVLRPGCRDAILDELAPEAGPRALTAALLEGLQRCDQTAPCVLVVDDFQVVDDEAVPVLLQRLPSWLHVVLLTRTAPNLPLDQLRGRGQLAEILFSELRFAPGEARELVNRLVPTLDERGVAEVVERSEGWAAGLRLTAHADSTPLIEDYTRREMLALVDAADVDALVDIAVVEAVNDGLARALTGRPDASEVLRRAEARGVLIEQHDAGARFRVHPLVRTALLRELTRRTRQREQHARAAEWLEAAGELPEALEQWLAADRPGDALRLLARTSAVLYDAGREATIRETLASIPPVVAAADVSTMLDFALGHLFIDRRTFVALVQRASWSAARTTLDDDTRSRLVLLEAMAAGLLGDWTGAGQASAAVLDALDDHGRNDPVGRLGWHTVARGIALHEEWSDDADTVREATLATSRDPARGLSLEGIRAVGLVLAGYPVDALRAAASVDQAAPALTTLASEVAFAAALARRELGDRSRAVIELEAVSDTTVELTSYCRIAAILALARMYAEEGALEAAERELGRALGAVTGEIVGAGLRTWFAVAGTAVTLAADDTYEAEQWAGTTTDGFWQPILAARIHLARGDRAAGSESVRGAIPRCVRHVVIHRLIAARCTPDSDEARSLVAEAVRLASAHNLVQTVASECSATMDLLDQIHDAASDEWLARVRRAAAITATDVRHAAGLAEPLTARERDVLRLLPSRLTIREIAKELYVSTNTLKFHLRVIYRKLGVNSRGEAAVFARSMVAPPAAQGQSPRTRCL